MVAPIVPHERQSGAGQALPMQRPFWQVSPPRHTLPQDPQLAESVVVSTHAPLQSVWPAGQSHVPLVHEPLAHAWPHAPQLFGSVVVSTHAPLQSVCPIGQEQMPSSHHCGSGHTLPHEPQFLRSSERKTHSPLQCAIPAGH